MFREVGIRIRICRLQEMIYLTHVLLKASISSCLTNKWILPCDKFTKPQYSCSDAETRTVKSLMVRCYSSGSGNDHNFSIILSLS